MLMQCVKSIIIDCWLEQSHNHTKEPTPHFKGIKSSVLCCWVFHYVQFQHLVEMKTRFVHLVYFAQPNNIEKCWCFVTYYHYVNWVVRHFWMVNHAIVPTCPNQILKESTDLSSFVENFIMFIFSSFVYSKHDFWTWFIKPNQTM
jgi:hypothetical protein